MKRIAVFLLIASSAAPLQAKGYYRVHPAHKAQAHAATKQSTPSPAPPATATATNQVAAQQFSPIQPARYVVQRPAAAAKTESSTNSPPPTPRGPEDAPKVSVSNEDPIVEYQKADAAKGFPEAKYALGVRYLTGNGVAQDQSKGKELIQSAADQGSERALEKLRELRSAGKL
jgi:TPR repeat protein